MDQKLAEIYVDDNLQRLDLLATIRDFDLTPYEGRQLAISVMMQGPSENQYISPAGLGSVEHLWPITVHLRDGKGYFIVSGSMRTGDRAYLATLYDLEKGRARIVGSIHWYVPSKPRRWEGPRLFEPLYTVGAEPPPTPPPEQQPISPPPSPPPVPPRSDPGGPSPAPDLAAENLLSATGPTDPPPPPPVRRPILWAIPSILLLLLAGGTYAYVNDWFSSGTAPGGGETEVVQKSRDIRWELSEASGTLDLAARLGEGAGGCSPPAFENGPAFGNMQAAGTHLSYARRDRGSPGSGLADAVDYQIVCSRTRWSGVVSISAYRSPAPTAVGDIELRLAPFEPTTVSIDELGPAVARGSDWRWHRAPQAASVVARTAADGRHIEIMLHATSSGRAPFELKARDGRTAQGTLVVIPTTQ